MRQTITLGHGCVAMLICSLLLSSCSIFKGAVKTFEDMSPKQKATWMMAVYNSEYDAYVARVEAGGLVEEDRQILRLKKQAMTVAWPLIRTYVSMIESGVLDADAESRAYEALKAVLGIGRRKDDG